MEEKILDLLENYLGPEIREKRDQELFESGLLDSLNFTYFIMDLEDAFDIEIPPTSIEKEDMDTANKIIEEMGKRLS